MASQNPWARELRRWSGTLIKILTSTADQAAEAKRTKYSNLSPNYIVAPIALKTSGTRTNQAIETSGTWNNQAIELVQEIEKCTSVTTRKISFQRISIAIQWGNAFSCTCTFKGKKLRAVRHNIIFLNLVKQFLARGFVVAGTKNIINNVCANDWSLTDMKQAKHMS